MALLKFQYKPRLKNNVIGLIFSVVAVLYMTSVAKNNQQGLVINGIFHFDVLGATKVYWAVVLFFALMIMFCLVHLIKNINSKNQILLSEKSISCPKNAYSKTVVSIPYTEISNIEIRNINKQEFLQIFHRAGVLIIPKAMLENNQEFESLVQVLVEKVKS